MKVKNNLESQMNKLFLIAIMASATLAHSQSYQAKTLDAGNGFTPYSRLFDLKQSARPAHCDTYYDPASPFTGCKYCDYGYYKDTTNSNYFFCTSCPFGCRACFKKNGSVSCTSCSSRYYLSGTSCRSCSLVTKNCDTCTDSTTCSSCNSGYYLNKGICKPCIAHCATCSDDETCDNCFLFYEYDSKAKICKEMPLWKRLLIYIAIFFVCVVGLSIWCCCCVCSSASRTGKVVSSFTNTVPYDAAGDEYNIN